MSKIAELNIKMGILKFARGEVGYSIGDLVKRLYVEEGRRLEEGNPKAILPFFQFLRLIICNGLL